MLVSLPDISGFVADQEEKGRGKTTMSGKLSKKQAVKDITGHFQTGLLCLFQHFS